MGVTFVFKIEIAYSKERITQLPSSNIRFLVTVFLN